MTSLLPRVLRMRALAALLAICAIGSCMSTSRPQPGTTVGTSAGTTESALGASSAIDAVREFFNALGEGDQARMSSLFGTADGPAGDKWGDAEVERRMVVLNTLLSFESFQLTPEPADSGGEPTRFTVNLRGTRYGDITLPVVAVSAGSRWFVERIVTDALPGTIVHRPTPSTLRAGS